MKSKILIIATVLTTVIYSCNNTKINDNAEGSDRDEHNCIGSAGASWSILKDSCVQIFVSGTQFSAYGKNTDSIFAAYVIISDDKMKAEVFLPSNYSNESIILDAKKTSSENVEKTLFENTQKMVKIDFIQNKYIISVKNEAVFSQNFSNTEGLGKQLIK